MDSTSVMRLRPSSRVFAISPRALSESTVMAVESLGGTSWSILRFCPKRYIYRKALMARSGVS